MPGAFPLWLAPVQVVVATIVSDAEPYATEVAALLKARGLAVVTDARNEKINAKIREHSLQHIPVIGGRRAQGGGGPHGGAAQARRTGAGSGGIGQGDHWACPRGPAARYCPIRCTNRAQCLIWGHRFGQSSIQAHNDDRRAQ